MNKLRTLVIWFVTFASVAWLSWGCSEKDYNKSDPAESFAYARESYDEENYDLALKRLGEFKSRFPYSKYAILAELFMANSHFELGNYEESSVAYALFIRLHPTHEQLDFAMYRVGESIWVDSPEDVDREQEYTARAIAEWEKLIERFPESQYSKKALELVALGKRRIAESHVFIANFYCKLEIYHACAYRSLRLIQDFPQYTDLVKKSYARAASAFEQLAAEKAQDENSDKNIYFKQMSSRELLQKAAELRNKAR